MEFDREVFDLMPSGSKTFNLIGLKMPSDKDIFFRAKQKETLDKYQAARRFMYELENFRSLWMRIIEKQLRFR